MDHYYKYVRWLSLDIVLGAIFFLGYLNRYFNLSLEWSAYFALAAAVWLIYTVDHLMDARSVEVPSCERHAFHKKYFYQLVFVAGLVLIMALVNVSFLDIAIIRSGAILSATCVAYLLLVYFVRKLWIKEILVALVYAVGIFLAPTTYTGLSWIMIVYIIQLSLIAFLNLLVFSYYDAINDENDGFNSLVIRLGKNGAFSLIQIVAYVSIISDGLMLVLTDFANIQLLYLLMTAILFVVFRWSVYFSRNERFRIVGDGIFYLPAIFLLF